MFKDLQMHTIPKLFYSYINERLKGSLISGMYCPYLYMLNNNEGQTMAELSRCVHMDKANTSRIIHELKKNGLVRIGVSERDKRFKKIYLTELGQEYVKTIETIRDEWESQLFHNIDDEDKVRLKEILSKIIINANSIVNKANKEDIDD